MVTSLSQLDPNATYSYADYLLWKFEERVELLRGHISKMAAPSRKHQEVSGHLFRLIINELYQTPCKVYSAPFDVRLTRTKKNREVIDVVQPDLCVVCDVTKLDDKGCSGPPELIIEILSPSNTKKEKQDKFELYRQSGVLEYWVADPQYKTIEVYTLNEKGEYVAHPTNYEGDTVTTKLIPDLVVEVAEVFQD